MNRHLLFMMLMPAVMMLILGIDAGIRFRFYFLGFFAVELLLIAPLYLKLRLAERALRKNTIT